MDEKHLPWAGMDIEKDAARPPAKEQASHPREAMEELDAIASAVGEGGHRSSRGAVLIGVFYGLLGICGIAIFLWLAIQDKDPNYTVAVAAVSGLDPATDMGGRPALDPEFNLTVGIVPRGISEGRCDEFTTTLKVAYHGYELASAAAPQVCDLGRGRTSTTVVARGAQVWLPGPVLDGLAADVRRAAGVFDVTLVIRMEHATMHAYGLLVSCMGRRVGDDAGAFCDVGDLHLERAH